MCKSLKDEIDCFPIRNNTLNSFISNLHLILKIGTGKIGLDTYKVCESMISAASERLHRYKMDVLFVIYPSSGSKPKDQTYQVILFY